MQTRFSDAQRDDADIRSSEQILRACVHCGFCTATCPTYVLLGDELDSPRGRIYLIKDMLENDRQPTAEIVTHIDRCLTCLSCMTTCPSGVHYMHLVDHARHRIEQTYRRPWHERSLRALLARVLPRPALFRLALRLAKPGSVFAGMLPKQWESMLRLAPGHMRPASSVDQPGVFPAQGARRKRVALLSGCAQQVLSPQINEATIRLLNRHGVEVVVAAGAGCCGALTHHLGQDGLGYARRNIEAWQRVAGEPGGLDAVIINASGCGTTVKDYGFMFREDATLAGAAAEISALARDVTEFLAELGLQAPAAPSGLKVAYHSACSLQHGQGVRAPPVQLLERAGFTVLSVPESHLCCGSAGTYNIMQPDIAGRLRDRKVAHIEGTGAEVVAAGNIGCITQIASGTHLPVVHTVELLDWATGGKRPAALEKRAVGVGGSYTESR